MEKDKYEILNEAKDYSELDELLENSNFKKVDISFFDFPDDYDYSNVIVIEDHEDIFIDLGFGAGFAQYGKDYFSLESALSEELNDDI